MSGFLFFEIAHFGVVHSINMVSLIIHGCMVIGGYIESSLDHLVLFTVVNRLQDRSGFLAVTGMNC